VGAARRIDQRGAVGDVFVVAEEENVETTSDFRSFENFGSLVRRRGAIRRAVQEVGAARRIDQRGAVGDGGVGQAEKIVVGY
jgi:hypothetical protein